MTRRVHKGWIIAGVLLLALVVAFSVPWKVNFLRDDIANRVQAATGRSFAIDGDLWWHWSGRVEAAKLRFGNPQWAGRDEMLTVEKLDARLELAPLLRRKLVLKQVHAVNPDLWLETTEDGRFNGNLDREQTDKESAVQLGRVVLDQGRLSFVEKHRKTEVRVGFENTAPDGQEPRLAARALGQWRGLQLAARGTGDGVLRLRDTTRPYGFDLVGTVGDTAVKLAGNLTGLVSPTAADLKVEVEGPTLAQWYRIADIGLPNTPPYSTRGHVRLKDGVWQYEDFVGRVGKSDIGGRVSYRPGGERPHVDATLVSKRLSLADFAPVIGKDKPKAGATAAPKRGKEQAPKATGPANASLLPQWSFSAEKWDTLDADVQFSGQSIIDFGRTPFENLKMHVLLDDGRLTLDPIEFGFAGGSLAGKLSIDGSKEPMSARLEARGRNVQLAELLPAVQNQRMALGTVNARAVLAGRGNSFAQMLGTADGEAQVAMGRGQISNLVLEIVDLDAAEALGFLVGGDKTVPVRCALLDVGFRNGLMESRTAVFDTADTIVSAGGRVNFADEVLDLRVTPVPKDPSPLTLRVPFDIKGTFKKPQVSPDKGKLALRAGSALVLGAINPLAALLPLIETGPGEDSDCNTLVARAKGEGVPVKHERTEEPAAAGTKKKPQKPTPQNRK
jgi:uncharacterized protein involved in outer membrane biogenesis